MKFKDEKHELLYFLLLKKMKSSDAYHKSAAYLMALADMNANDVFDFDEDAIKRSGLAAAWQTGTSLKATKLMFNLWNGWNDDAAVDEIFCRQEYAPYFYEAIKIRFEWDK